METSTYYLLPGEREEGDNSALCLICCVNLGEVMFSFIKRKKKNVCFQRCPCHQPGSLSSAVQMRYTAFAPGRAGQNCTQRGWNLAGCGSWPAPGSLGGKKLSEGEHRGISRTQGLQPGCEMLLPSQIKPWKGVKCFCSAHTVPWAALQGLSLPSVGVGIVPHL